MINGFIYILYIWGTTALAKSSWFVAKAPGALEREMTVASLEKKKISHLKRINEPP